MIPTNTLTLIVKEPGDATPHEGTWRIWLETVDGVAVNDRLECHLRSKRRSRRVSAVRS